jgi:hypothetical protein
MDYGTDFLLADDDVVFTADGDIALVSGTACVAQDIDQTLKITPGRLYWDSETGSSLPLVLNDTSASAATVIDEMERAAIADPRVDPASVKASYRRDTNKYALAFTPLTAIKAETLEYDVQGGV